MILMNSFTFKYEYNYIDTDWGDLIYQLRQYLYLYCLYQTGSTNLELTNNQL